jgi:hypothetical protein
MMVQFLKTDPIIHIYHLESSFRNAPPKQAAGIVLLKKKQRAIQYATLYILKLIHSTVLTVAIIISELISFFPTVVNNNCTSAFTVQHGLTVYIGQARPWVGRSTRSGATAGKSKRLSYSQNVQTSPEAQPDSR